MAVYVDFGLCCFKFMCNYKFGLNSQMTQCTLFKIYIVNIWDMLVFSNRTHAGSIYPSTASLTIYLLVTSADNFCKQVGTRSGPTFCRA